MFSLKKGVPIARIELIKGRKSKHEFLRLISESGIFNMEREQISDKPFELIDSTKEEEYFKQIQSKKEDKNKTTVFHLNDGILTPMPNVKLEREVFYISASSGSGKSVFTSFYLENYISVYPKRKIYVFSAIDEDEALDKLPITRITLDNELLEEINNKGVDNVLDLQDIKNSVVVFDDVDVIKNDLIREFVFKLRDSILETGRHFNITCLVTSHTIAAGRKTRTQLTEANYLVIFPGRSPSKQITYILEVYLNFSKDQIKRILKFRDTWVMISTIQPRYILTKTGAYLL